jgi:acetyl-CoA C-acetyltransferase
MLADVYLTPGARTPIGVLGGSLATLPATELGSLVIAAALKKAGISATAVDEVLMGNVLTAGAGQNPARQALFGAGLPHHAGATTIGKVCGSGLKAVMLAAQAIQCQDANVVVAGGMESMSQAPYLLAKARAGYRLGDGQLIDSLLKDGLLDAYEGHNQMGCFAQQTATEYAITREQQDDYAITSYQRALDAANQGVFDQQIVPVPVTDGKASLIVTADEQPKRFNQAKMRALRPAFSPTGTITAANASGINDGAAAVVVYGKNTQLALDQQPTFKILGFSSTAREPSRFALAPIAAITRLLDRLSMNISDVDLFEINEAFSVVALAAMRDLQIPHDRLNVNGGAVALGHPIGASGCRTLVTLLHALARQKARIGVVSLCIGGGEAVAMAVERL